MWFWYYLYHQSMLHHIVLQQLKKKFNKKPPKICPFLNYILINSLISFLSLLCRIFAQRLEISEVATEVNFLDFSNKLVVILYWPKCFSPKKVTWFELMSFYIFIDNFQCSSKGYRSRINKTLWNSYHKPGFKRML